MLIVCLGCNQSIEKVERLLWQYCSDTLAPSHIEKSSMEAGKTAFWAEENKFTTYGNALRDDYHFVPIAEKPPVRGSPWATNLLLILVEPLLESLRILSQHHLYFKQFQWQFNGATYNVFKVPMVNLLLRSLMKYSLQ